MSSIIGIVSERNTVPDLLHSLQQMAQASHNSCGLVVHGRQGQTLSPRACTGTAERSAFRPGSNTWPKPVPMV